MDSAKTSSPKRNQIIGAARKLFLESGYDATSMDAIAEDSGVSKRTAYNYFKNKEALFAAMMEKVIEKVCEEEVLAEMDQMTPWLELPPDVALKAAAKIYLKVFLAPEALDLVRAIVAESNRFPGLGEMYWDMGDKQMKSGLAEILSVWDSQGVLSIPDPQMAASQFIGMIREPYFLPLIFGFGNQPSAKELDATLDTAVSAFLSGLKPSSA